MIVNTENLTPVHEEMFRTLLRTPHRKVDEVLAIHQQQFERDPNFYGHLAVYAVMQGNCVVRDVNEVFIAVLLASPYRAHQEAGYVMFQDLPPYQAARVAKYFTGYDEIVKRPSYEARPVNEFGVTWEKSKHSNRFHDESRRGKVKDPKVVKLGRKSKLRSELLHKGKIRASDSEFSVQEYLVHHACLNKRNFKGALRSAAKSYLKYREQNDKLMEGALLRGHKHLKQFYVRTNTIPMGSAESWVNKFLWQGETVEGSRLAALKRLESESDPVVQAEIIMENKLPYTSVTSVIKNMTPSVLVALVNSMSYQELMQSLGSLKKRGAFDDPDIKALINGKLEKAQKASKTRIDAMKGAKAAKAVENLDADTASIVTKVTDSQIKRHGNISLRTVLMIDKSGSMTDAIELGKELGAAIAQACREDNPPITYMFDSIPTLIEWTDNDGDIRTKSAWDKKLEMFRAGGGTSPSTVVRALISNKTVVDQIVIVTDEGELDAGGFANQLKNYEHQLGHLPNVVIVRVGGYRSDRMERSMKSRNIDVDVLLCDSVDSVAMPNVIQLLSRKSVFDLIQEILSLSLPSRADWDAKHLSA